MAEHEAIKKFQVQKADAKRRGIGFLFTFEEWWDWWQTDNRWLNRGKGSSNFAMARNGDTGPYAPWNVHCATNRENTQEKSHEMMSANAKAYHARRRARGLLPSLAVRGAGHPQSRAVITPDGVFESGALAADHYGVTSAAIYHRIKCGNFPEFRWADSKRVNQKQLAEAAILKMEKRNG